MQAEGTVSDEVSCILDQCFRMVKRLIELVEIFFDHDEIQWTLEVEFAHWPLELVDVFENIFVQIIIKFEAGILHVFEIAVRNRVAILEKVQ